MGHGGQRIKEIRRMAGAHIAIVDPSGDKCLREITVTQGTGSNCAIENAIWLMNICINAFVEPSASLCPFGVETSLIGLGDFFIEKFF